MAKKQRAAEQQRAAELRNRQKKAARTASNQPNKRQNRRIVQRKNNSAWWWIGGIILACVVAIVAFITISNNQLQNQKAAGVISATGDPAVLKAVTTVPTTVLNTVNTGGLTSVLTPIPGKSALTGPTGKPEFFYYGAEWCPYCAADRWSMAVALSRFGTFKNLPETYSSSTDVDANTSTFTFVNTGYTSQYIDFVPLETQDRNRNTIETPNAAQQQILTEFNINGFPFIDIGNRYQGGSLYDPAVLANLSQTQIAQKLSNPKDPVTKNIVGAANYLTAAICETIQNGPAGVCTQGPIPSIGASLGQIQGNTQSQAALAYTTNAVEQRRRS